jgi:CubicO group peptidase (beta-lactamase class C family)
VDIPRKRDPRRRYRRVALAVTATALLAALPAAMSQRDASEPVAAAWAPPAATVGLDSVRLAGGLHAAAELPRLRTLIVARHGEIQLERTFRGPGPDTPVNVKSVSKSVLSALVGIAIAEGHLEGVEQPVLPFFQRYVGSDDDPRRAGITVGHLLSMQAGLEQTSGSRYGAWVSSPNWVRHAITRPMVAQPGGARIYSTGNTHLLSALLTEATGQSTWQYARERLTDRLGIALPPWPADPQGVFFGGNDMRISPRGLVRLGELYRNGGRLDGEQIVPEAWVRASLTPRAGLGWNAESYGYGWFLSTVRGHRMFYALGYGGQFVFVVPDLELTVVVTSDTDAASGHDHLRGVRRMLTQYIVPAAEAGAWSGDSSSVDARDGSRAIVASDDSRKGEPHAPGNRISRVGQILGDS